MAGSAKRLTDAVVRHLAGCTWADPYEPTEVLLWRCSDTRERPDGPDGPDGPDAADAARGGQRIRRWDSSK